MGLPWERALRPCAVKAAFPVQGVQASRGSLPPARWSPEGEGGARPAGRQPDGAGNVLLQRLFVKAVVRAGQARGAARSILAARVAAPGHAGQVAEAVSLGPGGVPGHFVA